MYIKKIWIKYRTGEAGSTLPVLYPLKPAWYGNNTDVTPSPLRISSSSSSPLPSLPVSALLACLPACSRSAPQAASPQRQSFGPNAHSAPLCSAWTRREAAGLRSRPRRRCALSQTAIRCLLPAHPTSSPPRPALLDVCGCRFDVPEKTRLIEGLRPGGISGAADRDGEKTESGGKLSTGETVIVNGLRSNRDSLQSLWVICGRRWRTEPRCFLSPPSIPFLPPGAGRSLRVSQKRRWALMTRSVWYQYDTISYHACFSHDYGDIVMSLTQGRMKRPY